MMNSNQKELNKVLPINNHSNNEWEEDLIKSVYCVDQLLEAGVFEDMVQEMHNDKQALNRDPNIINRKRICRQIISNHLDEQRSEPITLVDLENEKTDVRTPTLIQDKKLNTNQSTLRIISSKKLENVEKLNTDDLLIISEKLENVKKLNTDDLSIISKILENVEKLDVNASCVTEVTGKKNQRFEEQNMKKSNNNYCEKNIFTNGKRESAKKQKKVSFAKKSDSELYKIQEETLLKLNILSRMHKKSDAKKAKQVKKNIKKLQMLTKLYQERNKLRCNEKIGNM